jgi:hypothetical protein
MDFTKHYRAADGSQPAIIRERKWYEFIELFLLYIVVLYLKANK